MNAEQLLPWNHETCGTKLIQGQPFLYLPAYRWWRSPAEVRDMICLRYKGRRWLYPRCRLSQGCGSLDPNQEELEKKLNIEIVSDVIISSDVSEGMNQWMGIGKSHLGAGEWFNFNIELRTSIYITRSCSHSWQSYAANCNREQEYLPTYWEYCRKRKLQRHFVWNKCTKSPVAIFCLCGFDNSYKKSFHEFMIF